MVHQGRKSIEMYQQKYELLQLYQRKDKDFLIVVGQNE